MKKRIFKLLLALVAIATTAKAQVVLNEANFPDANFRAALASILRISEGDEITDARISATTELNVSSKSIADLTGIEHFTALTELRCSGNRLTSLDVSGCTALTQLYCYNNQLTSLDVSQNTALTELDCYSNQLTSLDVSGCTALTRLDCWSNQLTSLDVSQNTALTKLWCHRNQLTSLDVSKNTALTELYCRDNQLTSLDVSQNTALTWLYCSSNQLTSLDVSKNTALTTLYCSSNQLTSLDVSKNTALTKLWCDRNQLTSLDVSKNTALTGLVCDNNQLTSLDVSKNTALTRLECWSNQLTSLDVSQNTALKELYCRDNQLTSLDVSKNTALTWLTCDNNQLTSLDMSQNTALTQLGCDNNPLTSLDVSGCTALRDLRCYGYGNQFTSLDASGCTALTTLYCYNNQLTSLDVSGCTALKQLHCEGNQLASLDVSQNTALKELYCDHNQLTSLDVSQNTALTRLYCYGNQLTSLDVTKNTALKALECSNNQLTSLDVSQNTALTYLKCYSNQIKGEAMDALVNSLPTVESGQFYVINTKDENESNVCTKAQVAVAKGKGWTVYDYRSYGNQREYEGSDPVAEKLLLNAANFPDANFRKVLASILKINAGDEITDAMIQQTIWLSVSSKSIVDLTGIEHFTALTSLNCGWNQLTSLDVSKNTALTSLDCTNNQLTSLDVSGCTSLTELRCYNNQLTSLDVSGCTSLTELRCYNNQLTSLDVSGCTALTELWCGGNQIKGEAMDALVASLPTVTKGKFYVIDTKDENEGNVCTTSQVAVAKGKGWTVYDYNGSYATNRQEYEGSDYGGLYVTYQVLEAGTGKVLAEKTSEFSAGVTISWIPSSLLLPEFYDYSEVTPVTVSSDVTITTTATLKENPLFKFTSDTSNPIWYSLTLKGRYYPTYTADGNPNVALPQENAENDNTSWAFIGSPYGGFQIVNKAAGTNLVLSAPNIFNDGLDDGMTGGYTFAELKEPGTNPNELWLPKASSHATGGFFLFSQEGYALNERDGHLAFWTNGYDMGSTFVAKEVPSGIHDLDIDPVDEGDDVDFGGDLDDNFNLNGNVIGNIFYNIGDENGEYSSAEGCIVVKKSTSDENVDGTDIFGEEFKNNFTGIVFKVPAGNGTIKVNAETTGNMTLKVKVGNNAPVEMVLDGKLKATFPYNVSEPTYVYIYAGAANEAKGFGAPASGDAALKIYGIEFIRDNTPTDINSVDSGELTVDSWYTIDGKKLAGEPKEKGIYIRNGRKVIK